ncbi:hypothetical protein OEZ71_17660 [Defluviimonas sp. WL0050]|uniref:Uncharacterized protein n=1 Tax=Albidovulum litorale TaxID=2984134 RepID=A0ABT2ZSY4_9RHOB|nr:hypothetical protein [Defluviimonas sp. WL0050]MCV2874128.1 hypothetical protein [Defluviimonas sp. WL0050]
MTTLASPLFDFAGWLRFSSTARPATPPATEAEQDADRARRDFVLEMLDRHPEAFASDHSVQSMLSLYRERF